jgi:hypothetical protein
LGNFLNIPTQSGGRPAQFPSQPGGAQSKTVAGPGGGSATVVGGGGSRTTQGGATIGAGGAGVVVQGPGGGTHVAGVGGAGVSKGDYAAGTVGRVSGTQGPGGATAGSAGRISAATGPRGTVVAGGRAAGVRGPGGNAVGVAGGIRTVNGHIANTAQITAIRGGFIGYRSYYTPGWYARYPGAWFAAGVVASRWWLAPAWNTAYAYCGCAGQPVSYAYGETIVYQGDTVYYGDQPVASADQYYQQAAQIADEGAEPKDEQWMPLGVFAVVTEGQTQPEKTLQLAVNKDGVIRGNLSDSLTDSVVQVQGAVDKTSQRVAMRMAGKPDIVAECGLWNLTKDSLALLIHVGQERAETRGLIRLQQPEGQGQ